MKKAHKYILAAARAGFRVIPLYPGETGEGKKPGTGWPDTPYELDPDLSKFPANYGLALDDDNVVIDVDPRNGGGESWKKLQKDVGIPLAQFAGMVVQTGGGGGHFYFRKSKDFQIAEQIKDKYPGIELKTKGRQVVGPGSVNYKTKKPYILKRGGFDIYEPLPDRVLAIFKKDYKADILKVGLKDFDDSDDNIEFVRSVLADHPPAIDGQRGDDTTYQAACKCVEHGVSPQTAFDLMCEYNQRCEPPWDIDELEVKVRNAYRYAQNAMGSKSPLLDFENLAETEEKLPTEESVEYKGVAAKNFMEELKENWVFVLGVKRFVNATNMMELDIEQFDMHFARLAMKQKPSKVALMSAQLRRVNWQTYAPGKDLIVFEDKEYRLNMWRPSGLVAIPGDPIPFLEFVSYLVGPDKAWIVNDYIAFMARNPGEKILWLPLIKGIPGIGKSILGRCIEQLLGPHNVRRPTNQQIQDIYTEYMKSAQLIVVEEVSFSAQSALSVFNKLKELITEPYIEIRQMYKNGFKIPNRANFIMFTNEEQAMRIPKDDRRIAVIFSESKPREKSYYDELVVWIEKNAYALLNYYLYEHKLNPSFSAKGHAPMTKEKQDMIIREHLFDNFQFWSGRFANMSPSCLEEAFAEAFEDSKSYAGNICFLTAVMERFFEMSSSIEDRIEESPDKTSFIQKAEKIADMIRDVYRDQSQYIALFESYYSLIKEAYLGSRF